MAEEASEEAGSEQSGGSRGSTCMEVEEEPCGGQAAGGCVWAMPVLWGCVERGGARGLPLLVSVCKWD